MKNKITLQQKFRLNKNLRISLVISIIGLIISLSCYHFQKNVTRLSHSSTDITLPTLLFFNFIFSLFIILFLLFSKFSYRKRENRFASVISLLIIIISIVSTGYSWQNRITQGVEIDVSLHMSLPGPPDIYIDQNTPHEMIVNPESYGIGGFGIGRQDSGWFLVLHSRPVTD